VPVDAEIREYAGDKFDHMIESEIPLYDGQEPKASGRYEQGISAAQYDVIVAATLSDPTADFVTLDVSARGKPSAPRTSLRDIALAKAKADAEAAEAAKKAAKA